ncbi:MAG: hypothetical protein IPI73_19030 [Betaproteobacteria bacterium]|nr:hypothetical protein [Betaproteobacteria bacterium]
MRKALIVLCLMFGLAIPAAAQVSIQIGLPEVSIGINLTSYPQFVRVPGYPVYYAPRLRSNYFFYDGLYWVYRNDNWYASSWYNGPWGLVSPAAVPVYVLRIPVRYYRARPSHFSGWRVDAPPRWGEVWGSEWQQSRRGWDRWNRSAAPAPAPLPIYQRQYSGSRYPAVDQQPILQSRNYPYQPRENVVRQYYQAQGVQRMQAAPAPVVRQPAPQPRMAPQPVAPREPRAVQPPREPRVVQQQGEARVAPQPVAPREPRVVQPPREPRVAPQQRESRMAPPSSRGQCRSRDNPGQRRNRNRRVSSSRRRRPGNPRRRKRHRTAGPPRIPGKPGRPRKPSRPRKTRSKEGAIRAEKAKSRKEGKGGR